MKQSNAVHPQTEQESKKDYQIRDIFPNREFTKAEQLRIATQISKLLTQSGSRIERTGKK